MKLAVETRGGKQVNAELELVATCDAQLRFCKLQSQAKRSPMLEGESRPWSMKAKAQTLYPSLPNSLETLRQQEHREFNAQIDAEWGADQKYNINLRIQGEQSRRARMLIEQINNRENREERYNEMNKYELLERAAYLDQYKLEGEYTLSPSTKNLTYKAYNWLKAALWYNSEIKLGEIKETGRISAMWTVDPESRNYMNLTISSPVERISFTDIAMPFAVSPLNIRRASPSAHSFTQLMSRGRSMSGSCEIDGKRVETFDDVEYKTKMTTCYVLLAKDCSDESRPSYAVLMKKTEKSGEDKASISPVLKRLRNSS